MPRKVEVKERREIKEQARPEKPLRAKPLKGGIDHAALSREHMKRYPRIRAALAK